MEHSLDEIMSIIKKNQEEYPIRLKPILKELGLRVLETNEWPDNISGKLQKDENGSSGFSIYVNAKHPTTRKRFTIAHEIAHFALHKQLLKGDGLVDDAFYRSELSNAIEAEANKFAADLLMPWHLINKKIKDDHTDSISELAKAFNVSNSSMSIRLGVPYETNTNPSN